MDCMGQMGGWERVREREKFVQIKAIIIGGLLGQFTSLNTHLRINDDNFWFSLSRGKRAASGFYSNHR